MDNRQTTIISLLNEVVTLLEDEIDERKKTDRNFHLAFIEQSLKSIKHSKVVVKEIFNYGNRTDTNL